MEFSYTSELLDHDSFALDVNNNPPANSELKNVASSTVDVPLVTDNNQDIRVYGESTYDLA